MAVKSSWFTPAMLRNLQKMQVMGIAVLALALIPWLAADFLASFAVTQMTTVTTLRTTSEKDDARIKRAFAFAQRNNRVQASLVAEPNVQQQTRDAVLTVTAGSKKEVLADRANLTAAMQRVFVQEGSELYDIGTAPHASPVPNAQTMLIHRACTWGGLLILLAGLALMANRLLRSGLPPAAMIAIVAALGGAALLLFGGTLIWLALLPVFLLALMTVVTFRVQRAGHWAQGEAQITSSKVVVKRHQFAGEPTKVTNHAAVGYDFSVGSQAFHGNRISLGFAPSESVDVTLKRYSVGSKAPVFYDPTNPGDSVLERNPPARLGCLWGGALGAIVVYVAVLVSIGKSESIITALQAVLPDIRHPILAPAAGLFGLFCLGSWLWNRRHVRKVEPWSIAKGRIVSSQTETYTRAGGAESGHGHRYQSALVEFAYVVDGQEYHNTMPEPGTTQALAEAEVARYPVGTTIDIYYNPQNPTASALQKRDAITLDGRASLVVGFISLALAVYLVWN